jgi:hypothetical protein
MELKRQYGDRFIFTDGPKLNADMSEAEVDALSRLHG